MIKTQSNGNNLELYTSTFKIAALILIVFGLFRFTEPVWAGASQVVHTNNFRRPSNDDKLKYWLKNMVWHHRFTNAEIAAATGLANEEIFTAMDKFDIRPD